MIARVLAATRLTAVRPSIDRAGVPTAARLDPPFTHREGRKRIRASGVGRIHAAGMWYFERSPLAADAFRAKVFDQIDALAMKADQWPKDDEGVHFRVLSRFPYTLHYNLAGPMATVLAIAHQRRLPGYWQPRPGSKGGATDP